ncbi:MAG: endonuclease domain-containing protein [Alphaproteobacteria bacterium]
MPLSRIAGEGADPGLDPGEAGEGLSTSKIVAPATPVFYARALRQNSTDAERRLWSALRDRRLRGYRFRRQCPIGPFIVDFACTKHLLIAEADGGHHAGNRRDARRRAWLESRGWRVLRFWDTYILKNIEGVSAVVLMALRERETLTLPRLRRGPLPLPRRGRGVMHRRLEHC